MEDMMDDMFGGERYWQDGPDDDGDAEVAALWDGQLQMDRVLQTLQNEIESRKAAEKRVAELSAMVIKVAELEAEANRAYEAARNFENAHNSSCGAALDDLWKAILLEKDPDYGDWEYPAQAYRHLKDEYDDLNKRIAELEALLAEQWGSLERFKEGE
jgi:DNA repair exonuclease SbcCD ATPase subunit